MTFDPPAAVYRDAILDNAVRTLGLMDREPLSATRGCMDRTYWAWKFTVTLCVSVVPSCVFRRSDNCRKLAVGRGKPRLRRCW